VLCARESTPHYSFFVTAAAACFFFLRVASASRWLLGESLETSTLAGVGAISETATSRLILATTFLTSTPHPIIHVLLDGRGCDAHA
jgi:hypothetical protein